MKKKYTKSSAVGLNGTHYLLTFKLTHESKKIANRNLYLGHRTSDLGFNSISSDWTVESVQECKDE